MKITNQWQCIHSNLDVSLSNIHPTLFDGCIPQLPSMDLLKRVIPYVGGVSWRQALFSRARLKETKGQSITISKFHRNLDKMTISDNTVLSFTRLLLKLRKEKNRNEEE